MTEGPCAWEPCLMENITEMKCPPKHLDIVQHKIRSEIFMINLANVEPKSSTIGKLVASNLKGIRRPVKKPPKKTEKVRIGLPSIEHFEEEIEFHVDAPPKVIARLERLMGSDKVRITDPKYIRKLIDKFTEEEVTAWEVRSKKRKKAETTRYEKLAIDGLIQPDESIKDIYDNPLFRINETIRRVKKLGLGPAEDLKKLPPITPVNPFEDDVNGGVFKFFPGHYPGVNGYPEEEHKLENLFTESREHGSEESEDAWEEELEYNRGSVRSDRSSESSERDMESSRTEEKQSNVSKKKHYTKKSTPHSKTGSRGPSEKPSSTMQEKKRGSNSAKNEKTVSANGLKDSSSETLSTIMGPRGSGAAQQKATTSTKLDELSKATGRFKGFRKQNKSDFGDNASKKVLLSKESRMDESCAEMGSNSDQEPEKSSFKPFHNTPAADIAYNKCAIMKYGDDPSDFIEFFPYSASIIDEVNQPEDANSSFCYKRAQNLIKTYQREQLVADDFEETLGSTMPIKPKKAKSIRTSKQDKGPKLDDMGLSMDEMGLSMDEMGLRMDEMGLRMDEMGQSLDDMEEVEDEMEEMPDDIGQTQFYMEGTEDEMEETQDEVEETQDDMEQINDDEEEKSRILRENPSVD